MSALLQPEPQLRAMQYGDLDRVLAIERCGLRLPVDARQLRRFAGGRLPGRSCCVHDAPGAGRLLRGHGRGRRDAPAEPHGGAGAAAARPCAQHARRCWNSAAASRAWPALAGGAREQSTRPGIYARRGFAAGRRAPRLLPGAASRRREDAIVMSLALRRAERAMAWTERQRAMLQEMGIRVLGGAEAPKPPCRAAGRAERRRPGPAAGALSRRVPPPTPGARRDRHRRMDWPALREAVAACTACSCARPAPDGVRRRRPEARTG